MRSDVFRTGGFTSMRNTGTAAWQSLAALALVTFVLGTNAFADDANVAGTWNLSIESPQGKRTPTLTLTQSGSVLSGTYKSQMGEAPVTGKVTGNDFNFDVKLSRQGQDILFVYKGAVAGGDMKGTLSMGKLGDVPFTGTRATP
jgi:hypothetical protein